ncbi:MarR family winged helix-turn-helix transcriptional regulator [Streptomyces sp. NBC_01262]|uniref:MarR family winged helix-turn-helix transcriptional regulator n=1 Tax=Streptomyces sp. NBC_01262 TaxID=2903803 RepID=UPI002E30CE0C|nr:MarR family winged helix-turn-helix transcriptional regulator [Streptomyces sp. NBC_01262]
MPTQPRSEAPAPPAAPAPAGDGADARLLTEVVTRLRRALRASIRTDYPWETLPMAQVELLQVLAEHSPTRISTLAARQRLATSTVSGLVGQMITAGLVARAVDPADRRASAVTLTDAGRDQLAAWAGAHERRLDAALSALDDSDPPSCAPPFRPSSASPNISTTRPSDPRRTRLGVLRRQEAHRTPWNPGPPRR